MLNLIHSLGALFSFFLSTLYSRQANSRLPAVNQRGIRQNDDDEQACTLTAALPTLFSSVFADGLDDRGDENDGRQQKQTKAESRMSSIPSENSFPCLLGKTR